MGEVVPFTKPEGSRVGFYELDELYLHLDNAYKQSAVHGRVLNDHAVTASVKDEILAIESNIQERIEALDGMRPGNRPSTGYFGVDEALDRLSKLYAETQRDILTRTLDSI